MAERVPALSRRPITGRVAFPAVQLTGDVAEVGLECDTAEHLDPAVTVACDVEISRDGGQTFTRLGSFTRRGGPGVDRDGQPITRSSAVFFARNANGEPVVLGRNPRVRGALTVTGGQLTTKTDLTARTLADVTGRRGP